MRCAVRQRLDCVRSVSARRPLQPAVWFQPAAKSWCHALEAQQRRLIETRREVWAIVCSPCGSPAIPTWFDGLRKSGQTAHRSKQLSGIAFADTVLSCKYPQARTDSEFHAPSTKAEAKSRLADDYLLRSGNDCRRRILCAGGKVSAEAGMLTPFAFLAAALIAMFSAFSYAELSARYPYSAGEAHYELVAFRKLWPSAIVGWAVVATGLVSAATLANAFAGFMRTLVEVPEWLLVCAMVVWHFARSLSGLLFVCGIRGHGQPGRRSKTSSAKLANCDPRITGSDGTAIFLRYAN